MSYAMSVSLVITYQNSFLNNANVLESACCPSLAFEPLRQLFGDFCAMERAVCCRKGSEVQYAL